MAYNTVWMAKNKKENSRKGKIRIQKKTFQKHCQNPPLLSADIADKKEDKMKNINKLQNKLETLKKNDDYFAQNPGTKERCMKSYVKLKKEICAIISEIMPKFVFSGLRFDPKDKEEVKTVTIKIQESIERSKNAGLFDAVKEAAFTTYNLDEVINAMTPIHNRVVAEAYGDYWIKKCQPIDNPEYTFYNPIVEMYYSESAKVWTKKLDDGNTSVSILFPPKKELMDIDYPVA